MLRIKYDQLAAAAGIVFSLLQPCGEAVAKPGERPLGPLVSVHDCSADQWHISMDFEILVNGGAGGTAAKRASLAQLPSFIEDQLRAQIRNYPHDLITYQPGGRFRAEFVKAVDARINQIEGGSDIVVRVGLRDGTYDRQCLVG